jgi:hypothetical protein
LSRKDDKHWVRLSMTNHFLERLKKSQIKTEIIYVCSLED